MIEIPDDAAGGVFVVMGLIAATSPFFFIAWLVHMFTKDDCVHCANTEKHHTAQHYCKKYENAKDVRNANL